MDDSPLELGVAREALRASPEDDFILDRYITAAKAAVFRYLGWEREDYDAASAADRIAVETAILILTGHYYRSPDVDDAGAFSHGQLPWMVTAALYQMRDPALA